jgi:integrase
VRTIPVHDCAAHVLERRYSGTADEYLFDSLLPGGVDKRRSSYVSKAFRRYTDGLGLQDGERRVFHSLRKTFVEALEAAEVPLTTIQLLIGHKRQSLALTKYSTGARVELRKANKKLRYSEDLDRLIRQRPQPEDDDTNTAEQRQGGAEQHEERAAHETTNAVTYRHQPQ